MRNYACRLLIIIIKKIFEDEKTLTKVMVFVFSKQRYCITRNNRGRVNEQKNIDNKKRLRDSRKKF